MRADLVEIEQFLYREARLLDQGRLDDWLALFAADAVYWVPAGGEESDPEQHVSIIYDTRDQLARRVARLQSGYAHAQDPPARTYRVVSNVELTGAPAADEVGVSSVMALFELRRHRHQVHSARCEFALRREGADWRIVRKTVRLLRSNEVLDVIPYLV